jgi:hypothetical protein
MKGRFAMKFNNKKQKTVLLTAIFLCTAFGFGKARDEVIELEFGKAYASEADVEKTLKSMVKVRAISETYSTGGLYLMTHFGDRDELFQQENKKLIDNPFINQTWRYCSLFATSTENSVLLGRNWDNQNVGSIIVSLYHPANGYSSISFSRAIEMGFPLNVDLQDFKSNELGNRLLLAPFYAMDGINEHGLAVALAGVNSTPVKPKSGKEIVFISFLIRKILDQTKTIKEAVNLVEKYIPFLLDKNSLEGHLLIVDSSGKSVILEYVQDQWEKIYPDNSWQVLTNRQIYNVPDENLKKRCWRYRSISATLEKTKGNVDWKECMEILRDVTQKGTTWSAVYSPSKKELYFSVYQEWDKIYHLFPFE